MKVLCIVVLLVIQTAASAETISKWIDVNGRIHYGDNWLVKQSVSASDLDINNTFDQDAYNAASKRYKDYEKELESKDKQHKKLAKKKKRSLKKAPLTASEKYDAYLEKEELKEQKELNRKRERRADARRKWKMDCNDSRNANRIACR